MDIDFKAILQAFLIETEENLQAMEEALLVLENQPDDNETLQTIFRGAHTVKGSAGSLGFTHLAEFTHILEDLLDRLRKHTIPVTADLISLLLEAVDALRQLVPAAVDGDDSLQENHRDLMRRFTEKAATKKADVAEAKPPQTPTVARAVETCKMPAVKLPASLPGPENTLPTGELNLTDTAMLEKTLVTDSLSAPETESRTQRLNQNKNNQNRTLRVDTDKLDRMMNLTGEIAIARGRLRQMLEESRDKFGESVLEVNREADRLYMELQEQVMKLRMVPVDPFFRQYIRNVRDVAPSIGKQAHLVIEGGDVEVDTTVIEHLKDPLMHMIRNALDHGIELPKVRAAKGKDISGKLTLRAFHDAGSIVIQLADDGAGFNRERILARAISRGLVTEPDKMSDSDLFRLVFESGFSTAEVVTDLSGRGVGMEVVLRNIDAIRGLVTIESETDIGSTITIRLPLTLAIIDGFGVGVDSETYVLPLDAVTECLTLPEESQLCPDGRGVMNLRGEALPYLRLRNFFDVGGDVPTRENVVVVRHNGKQTGLVVDALYGESQAVIKPLNDLFQGLPGISGSTILGNGRVALILDIPSLLQKVVGRQAQLTSAAA